MSVSGAILAILVGLSLGLLGGGGSILTVPIFVYASGFDPKQAIAMSLAVVGATSLFGAISHWRVGNVNLRVAAIFGSVAMVGTYLGARLADFFSGAAQLVLFAIVILVAAIFMFRRKPAAPDASTHAGAAELRLGTVVPVGLGVGVLTGLVGIGGGFMIVPALVLLGKVPMKEAVGTSLLVIAMNAATGFYGYLGQVDVAWGAMIQFTAAAVAGILSGAFLARLVSPHALQRTFAVFLVAIGLFILFQNRAAVFLSA